MQIESKEEKPQQQKSQQKTKKLWGKLKNLLLNKDEFTLQQQLYLNILPKISHENNIVEYSLGKENMNVVIRQQRQTLSLEEVKKNNEQKVDSTGTSLWPAEELLAYYCLKNIQMFSNMKKIAEYGAGYSGLAGIALAKLLMLNSSNSTFQIEISDGNEECANLLKDNLQLNISSSQNDNLKSCVTTKQYIWEENGEELPEEQKFDCIIIADCLFFRNFHNALINTIYKNLSKEKGQCIIIAPQRGGTLQEFLQKCEGKLQAQMFNFEDEQYKNIISKIQENPQYNKDMHEYFFINIKNNVLQ